MNKPRIKRWATAGVLALAMPAVSFAIIGWWWRSTFHWEKDYVQPFYWTVVFFLGMALIAGAPLPLLWRFIKEKRANATASSRAK